MITLPNPITINLPAVEGFPITSVTLSKLDWSVNYDNSLRRAWVCIKGINRTIPLWSGAAFDAAGQWTDGDVDARLKEILGDDLAAGINRILK